MIFPGSPPEAALPDLARDLYGVLGNSPSDAGSYRTSLPRSPTLMFLRSSRATQFETPAFFSYRLGIWKYNTEPPFWLKFGASDRPPIVNELFAPRTSKIPFFSLPFPRAIPI